MARVLALNPVLAAKIELLFFDGEEAFENFTATDGLYGSRHFAQELHDSGKAKSVRGGILFDMIGEKSLNVTLPSDSSAAFTRKTFSSVDAFGIRAYVT